MIRLVILLAAFALVAPTAFAVSPRPIPSAYTRAANHAGVPSHLLFAVALQESGITLHGRHVPWPWTLNVAGRPARFTTRREACSALKVALHAARGPVDVGLGQVNAQYHRHRVRAPCELLDPYRNLTIAAAILREQYRPNESWSMAVGRYHRPAGGAPALRYRRGVERQLTSVVGATWAAATLQGRFP